MFLVFNKEKIYAYLVSILTVCLLFFIASTNTDNDVETSTKVESSYNVSQENLVPNDDLEDGQNE
ncbi:MAG: hypothetical protein IKF97_05095 [Clostridia bacterium]|nr:hypothetical protein [Clostridia bacterium]